MGRERSRPGRWLHSKGALIGTCAADCTALMKPTLMPFWIERWSAEGRVPASTIAWIVGIEFLIVAVVNLLALSFIYRFERRRLARCAGLATFMGNILTILPLGLGGIIAGRMLAGMGEGVLGSLAKAMAAQSPQPQRTFSAIHVSFTALSIILLFIAPMLVATVGSNGPFILLAIVSAIGICLMTLLPEGRLKQATRKNGTMVRTWQGASALFAMMAAAAGASGLWAYAIVAGRQVGIPLATLSTMLMVSVFFALAGSLTAARVRQLPAIFFAFCVLATVAGIFGFAKQPLLVMGAICVLPFGGGLVLPILSSAMARIDPEGKLPAIGGAAMFLGSAIGASLIGFFLNNGGYLTFFVAYVAALVIAGTAIARAMRALHDRTATTSGNVS